MRVPTTQFSDSGNRYAPSVQTGLSTEQFAELCEPVLAKMGPWSSGRRRPNLLSLGQPVKVTVMYEKNNVTREVLGELFGVSQPTVSQIINKIEPITADVLAEVVPHAQEVPKGIVVLVDGTLTPCWSWAMHRSCAPASTRQWATTT